MISKMKREMKNKIKRYTPAVVGSSAFAVGSLATSVFATGTADTNVTTAFTTVGDNLSATVGAVAPYAIGVMACILGFRYAKKIFKVIANG